MGDGFLVWVLRVGDFYGGGWGKGGGEGKEELGGV